MCTHRFITITCAVFLTACATVNAGPEDWQHFRSFGGRTALGEITMLAADPRYVYAFTATGGARYDKLKEKWDFTYPLQTPGFAADFTALDPYTGDIYFVAGSRLHPFHPLSGIWYTAIEFPAAVRQIAFEGRAIAARTDRGIYLCDRWNSAISQTNRTAGSFNWINAAALDQVRSDGRLGFLMPYSLMDRWAILHPLTALAFEPATQYVWAAYAGMGLWKYDRMTRLGVQVTKGFLASQNVIAFYGNGTQIGLAGQGGVTLFDEEKGQWQQLDRLFNLDLAVRQIRDLAFDDREIFIGTDDGIVALATNDDFARTITGFDGLPDNIVNCLALAGDSLWAGTDQGVALYRRSAKSAEDHWPELRFVICNGIACGGGRAYLATSRGGFFIDFRDSMKLKRFSDNAPFELWQELRAVVADDSMVWWLAPDGLAGLNQKTQGWRHYTRTGHYAAGQGLALAVDSQNVWIGTDAGLARFDKASRSWRTYRQSDGLLDEAVLAVWSKNGYVWAGGKSGASRFKWKK
ncbi:MAG: hypothetical protein QME74_11850 [Candidatus Edwardsbacteria bacterium]|nr:hypothetical protein [Candidatus Edwardsbacteria bacterium]